MNYKVIFIVGYWKSGTTLLQHLLAKDKNIQNPFIFDGTELWEKYFPMILRDSDIIPKSIYKDKIEDIRKEINSLYNKRSLFILLKRPQFILNINLIKDIFKDNAYIIGIKRNLIPNIYSMLRMRKENNYPNTEYIGLYPPGWKRYAGLPIIGQLVWQYYYANNTLDKSDIMKITYEDLCDNTKEILNNISDYINYDININIPKLRNLNDEYKTGRSIKSWNEYTKNGILSPNIKNEIDFPPLTKSQMERIRRYSKMFENILKNE